MRHTMVTCSSSMAGHLLVIVADVIVLDVIIMDVIVDIIFIIIRS